MELRRNKNQPMRSESSTSYRYKQIRSYKNRINLLQKSLQELTDEMIDLDKKKHYQSIIDADVKKFRPFKKTSKFRGVSWHNPSQTWRARLHVKDEEHITYHDTQLEAALAYDDMAKAHYPDRPWYKNFLSPDEQQDDVAPPKMMTVPEKRKAIGKYLSGREARAIHPMGIGYFNKRQCTIAIAYIEEKEGITIGPRSK